MTTSRMLIKRTAECQANPVLLDGKEIGSVEWTGCFYTKRGGREVRSQGFWFITGKETGLKPLERKQRFTTMKKAAEALCAEYEATA